MAVPPSVRVTRKYRFSASHRLHRADMSESENQAVYGKCNNPHGHGHDYVLQVAIEGPLHPETGVCLPIDRLDRLVDGAVLGDIRNADLNALPCFHQTVPTTENLLAEVERRLLEGWSGMPRSAGVRLAGVRIQETRRNTFESAGMRISREA